MNPYAATFQGSVAPSPANITESSNFPDGDGKASDEQHGSWDAIRQDHDPGQEGSEDPQYWDYATEYDANNQGYPVAYDPGYHQQVPNGAVLGRPGREPGAGGAARGPGWGELRRVYEERGGVTALQFDPLEELLWAGHSDGRLTSYLQPDMTKHSSVLAHKHRSGGRRSGGAKGPNGSIIAISALGQGVMSISTSAIRLHTRGGLIRATLAGKVETPGVRGIPPTSHLIENLTCCTLNSPMRGLGMGATGGSTSRVTVGTLGSRGGGVGGEALASPPSLLQVDPLSGLRLVRAVTMPQEAGVMAMERGAMLAVGGEDGRIRLLDPRLRSSKVEHVLEAHTGPVQALAVTPTDGLKIVSVGMTSKSLNPYDVSAPSELYADPVVRVFDARMPGRPGPPLQFSMLGAPHFVHFLADESLALASASGQFLLSKEPFTDTPRLDFQMIDGQGTGETLTCMAVASSGDGIALGSTGGACIQMGHGEQDVRCNLSSRDVEGPERPAPPAEVYVHPCDQSPPASKYVLRQTAKAGHRTGPLSSSFTATPRVMRAVLRRPPPRRPAKELLEKAAWRDYLGVIPNPGYEPNSLLFGKGKAAYEVVDPRRRKDKDPAVFDRRNSLGDSIAALRRMGLEDIPRRYRRPVLNLGRLGFDGFDFSRYNSTEYAGLENGIANAYVNSILQLLFFVPEVRETALREQYNPVHYSPHSGRATSGLACELGFLFQQLERAKNMEPRSRSCQPTNFLRAFKEVPEVLALGLLEDPQDKRAIGLPRKAEALHRFLLSQLDKEASKEPLLSPPSPPPTPAQVSGGSRAKKDVKTNKSNGRTKGKASAGAVGTGEGGGDGLEQGQAVVVEQEQAVSTVDRLYGYGIRTTNAFLHRKGVSDVKNTRTLVTEMIPVDHVGCPTPAKHFADVLARSLCRETRARAWCEETGGYAPIKQRRCPISLPEVMPIHCAATLESSEATRVAFRGKNCRGGPWLPQEIEITLVEKEDGEPTVVVGESADLPARWMQELEAQESLKLGGDSPTDSGFSEGNGGELSGTSTLSTSSLACSEKESGEDKGSPAGSSENSSVSASVSGAMSPVVAQITREAFASGRNGWYFASPPQAGKDRATSTESEVSSVAETSSTKSFPGKSIPGKAGEEDLVDGEEDKADKGRQPGKVEAELGAAGGERPPSAEAGREKAESHVVVRNRYTLVAVVSRVIPGVRKAVKEASAGAGAGAGTVTGGGAGPGPGVSGGGGGGGSGGSGEMSLNMGGSASGATSSSTAGDEEDGAEEGHLVLHVRVDVAANAQGEATSPDRGSGQPPAKALKGAAASASGAGGASPGKRGGSGASSEAAAVGGRGKVGARDDPPAASAMKATPMESPEARATAGGVDRGDGGDGGVSPDDCGCTGGGSLGKGVDKARAVGEKVTNGVRSTVQEDRKAEVADSSEVHSSSTVVNAEGDAQEAREAEPRLGISRCVEQERRVEGKGEKIESSPDEEADQKAELTREQNVAEGRQQGADDEERVEEDENWLIFNDFLVERTVLEDARGFGPEWKEPCVLVYRRMHDEEGMALPTPGSAAAAETERQAIMMAMSKRMSIPASVFEIPSLSKNGGAQVRYIPPDRLPSKGDIVAIDAEFVSLMVEESRLRGDGSKVVTKQGRQALARVSVLDGRSGSETTAPVIMDDYVVQSEPVVDHLTRFSGITPEDLDPVTSVRSLHYLRTVYLRLRWLADAGCIFLGHGLNKDFRMFNLTLPPEQVIDTVKLWSIPGQRSISLRFLAHCLLSMNIQGETHDSIEDARIALALYNKYRTHVAAGTMSTALDALYKYGWKVSWKLDGGRPT